MELADAYRRVEAAWNVVGLYAASAELLALRKQAMARARGERTVVTVLKQLWQFPSTKKQRSA